MSPQIELYPHGYTSFTDHAYDDTFIVNRTLLDAYDEVLSGYQPGKVVPFCGDQRFEDHLCLRPQGR
jgi:hypothetical protein